MAKRMQELEGDNKNVAQSRPTTMNLAVSVSTSSSAVNSPIASESPVILKASSRQIGQLQGNLTQEIPITTQRRFLKDGEKMLYWTDVQGNLSRQKNTKNT